MTVDTMTTDATRADHISRLLGGIGAKYSREGSRALFRGHALALFAIESGGR
jgi:hypothetical protein